MDTDVLSHLAAADIFAVLTPGERADLARDIHVRELPAGAVAVRQGERGSSLFIVVAGRLSVYMADAGDEVYLGDLWDGEFFGEMSLLTGSPRTATVKAARPVTLIEVTREQLAPLMHRHGELAAIMGEALARRQSSNLKALMDFERPVGGMEADTVAAGLSFKIRRFFDLPTSIWGRAVAGVSGFSLKGPLGFILGKTDSSVSAAETAAGDDRQIAFTTAIITLAAKMAAAGGSYSQKEVALLQDLFAIPAGDMANVRRIFNRAQGNAEGFEPYARQIARLFEDQPAVREELLIALIKIAHAARSGQLSMLRFIDQVANLFGFDAADVQRLTSMARPQASTGAGGGDISYLTVLSLAENASLEEAKRAYHKLAKENHPDKLMADGMPAEFRAQANEKLVLINRAYEQFVAARTGQR